MKMLIMLIATVSGTMLFGEDLKDLLYLSHNFNSAIHITKKADIVVVPLTLKQFIDRGNNTNSQLQARMDQLTAQSQKVNGLEVIMKKQLFKLNTLGVDRSIHRYSAIELFITVDLNTVNNDIFKGIIKIKDYVAKITDDKSTIVLYGNSYISLRNSELYRDELIKKIATKAKRYKTDFGSTVTVVGLEKPLLITQASGKDVFITIDYKMSVGSMVTN